MLERMHEGGHEVSDLDREIINLDAQGKTGTKKFDKLWKKKDKASQEPAPAPEETLH